MEFEWDKKKAKINEKKHRVSFHEAGTVFGDPLALTFNDPDNSINEFRLITFGLSRLGKKLIVSHTIAVSPGRDDSLQKAQGNLPIRSAR